MTPITSFFRYLESKCCAACGQTMVEQAESYMTECFTCQEKATHDAYLYYRTKK
ncbi:protein YhfH [Brevibacillus borstelensis]|uniref:protein YhfH n=1 Tax=Brevibacillus borstelensis TaxID=45462 RepID=UPI0030BF84FF